VFLGVAVNDVLPSRNYICFIVIVDFVRFEPHLSIGHNHLVLGVVNVAGPTLVSVRVDLNLVLLCPEKEENTNCELNHSLSMPNSERKSKRTVISLAGNDEFQPQLDFDEAENSPPFTFPDYQRGLIVSRITAGLVDLLIVAAVYVLFLLTTLIEMPENIAL